jgi:hypothetical protein
VEEVCLDPSENITALSGLTLTSEPALSCRKYESQHNNNASQITRRGRCKVTCGKASTSMEKYQCPATYIRTQRTTSKLSLCITDAVTGESHNSNAASRGIHVDTNPRPIYSVASHREASPDGHRRVPGMRTQFDAEAALILPAADVIVANHHAAEVPAGPS